MSYYINTNEIPGELSRENMMSSHVKITCYLHLRKDHGCYGHMIHRAFRSKKNAIVKWFGISLVFHIINRTLHDRLEIRNFSSSVEKYFQELQLLTIFRVDPSRCMHQVACCWGSQKVSQ